MATLTNAAGDVATFVVYDQGFKDDLTSALEQWHLPILVSDPTSWGLLNTMRTPKELVTVRTIAGQTGTTVQTVIDIGGGGGVCALVVEELDSHNAILIGLDRSFIDQGGASLGTAVFLVTDP